MDKRNVAIADFSDHLEFIKAWAVSNPQKKRGQQHRIAQHLRIHPTLMSQIMHGRRQLNLDQAGRLCDLFKLSDLESEYFVLLVQRSQAENQTLKKVTNRRLESLKSELAQVAHRIQGHVVLSDMDKAKYYSDALYGIVRLLSDFDAFSTEEQFADFLHMPITQITKIVDFLLQRDLMVKTAGKFRIGPAKVHVPAHSDYVNFHHRNWRLQTLNRIGQQQEVDLLFTSPMTISRRDFNEAKKLLLDTIGKISEKVADSEGECFALFNVDLLKMWSKP